MDTAVLTAGGRHEQLASPAPLDTGAGRRRRGGRQRRRRRHTRPVIPTRKGEKRQPFLDKANRERDGSERLISRFEQFRHIVLRHEKGAADDLALVRLGMIVLRPPRFAETPRSTGKVQTVTGEDAAAMIDDASQSVDRIAALLAAP